MRTIVGSLSIISLIVAASGLATPPTQATQQVATTEWVFTELELPKPLEPAIATQDVQIEKTLDVSPHTESETDRAESLHDANGLSEDDPASDPSLILERPRKQEVRRRLIVLTDPSWCAACRQMEPHLDSLRSSGTPLTVLDGDDPGVLRQYRHRSIPTIIVIENDREVSRASGYRTAEQMRRMLQAEPDRAATAPKTRYWTQRELLDQIRKYRSGQSRMAADVSPRSQVWSHLRDSNHRFTTSQVNGLSQSDALWLHAAHHDEKIFPTTSGAPPQQQSAGVGVPTTNVIGDSRPTVTRPKVAPHKTRRQHRIANRRQRPGGKR